VGVGVACLDYIATVEHFPRPDEKLRTSGALVTGGGNSANTLCAMARLGCEVRLVAKVGADPVGDQILSELREEGVDITHCLRSAPASAFSYVIVEAREATRTILHTAGEDMTTSEVNFSCLDGASLLHLDGRHPKAAVKLAEEARRRGIPVALELEKADRHGRDVWLELMGHATLLMASTEFPTLFTGASSMALAMEQLLALSRTARLCVATRGAQGSIVVVRPGMTLIGHRPMDLDQLPTLPPGEAPVLQRAATEDANLAAVQCGAWPLDEASTIVDTTGAGDAFIGGFLAGLIRDRPILPALLLATFTAARKCQQHGTRSGLPKLHEVPDFIQLNERDSA